MKYNYIVIEGIIGSGKTTLATMLAEEFNGRLILEKFADNPFLPKFYENPAQYSFPLEMSFLAERYQHIANELTGQDLFHNFTISDYHIIKSLIFAQNNLTTDEYKLFTTIYKIIFHQIPKPDLWIYLHVDPQKALKNIQKRGRSYEQNITVEYLENIQKGYLNYLKQLTNQRILMINTDTIDFVSNSNDYLNIKHLISLDYDYGITLK